VTDALVAAGGTEPAPTAGADEQPSVAESPDAPTATPLEVEPEADYQDEADDRSGSDDVEHTAVDEIPKDPLSSAREMVAALFDARGIRTVVHVDDDNPAADQAGTDIEMVIGALETGLLTITDLAAVDATAALVGISPNTLTETSLIARLQQAPDQFTAEDLQALTDAARVRGHGPSSRNDITEVDTTTAGEDNVDLDSMAEIREVMPAGVALRPMTAADWQAERDAVLASTDPVLVLFDRDFSHEGRTQTAGDDLLIDAIRSRTATVYVGMLTHNAPNDDAESGVIAEIAERGQVDVTDVVVISRQTVHDSPERLPVKLKAALMSGELRHLRDSVVKDYDASHAAALRDVASLTAFEIAELVRAADGEGAHGSHNLLRIASTRLRLELDRSVRTDAAIDQALSGIRQLDDTAPRGRQFAAVDISARRHLDLYDASEHLADLHLPLEPGDIFEKINPAAALNNSVRSASKRYVLLVQPCDLAVRADGLRIGDPKLLTVARLVRRPADAKEARRYDHELKYYGNEVDGSTWWVQVWNRVQIPLVALEACVFGAGGTAVVTVDATPPPGLTPGWLKRFEHLQRWARACLDTYLRVMGDHTESSLRTIAVQAATGMSSQMFEIPSNLDPAKQRVAFGLRRIGRIADGETRVMLAHAANHMARPATEGPLFPE